MPARPPPAISPRSTSPWRSIIGEIFGGARVDLGVQDSIEQATGWAPDLVIAEPFDAIGPIVAARLGVGWHRAGIGPALPAVISEEIDHVAAARYDRLHLRPVAVSSYLDPCPARLQDPNWSADARVRAVRPQAHRRPKEVALDLADFAEPDKPTALVTLGTIFSNPRILSATVAAVTETGANVIATLGSSLKLPTESAASPGQAATPADSARVRYVPFVPLAQLLERADLVVGAGGVGTIIATLAHGLPMVLWPQGADQPVNAARATASGTSITVDSAAGVPAAVAEVLENGAYRRRAQDAAVEIANLPRPATVIAEITRACPVDAMPSHVVIQSDASQDRGAADTAVVSAATTFGRGGCVLRGHPAPRREAPTGRRPGDGKPAKPAGVGRAQPAG